MPGTTLVKGTKEELFTFTGTPVGASDTVQVDLTAYKTIRGYIQSNSSNVVLDIKQSNVSSPWDVSTAVAAEAALVLVDDIKVYGQYGEILLTVNSAGGDFTRVQVFGVPL